MMMKQAERTTILERIGISQASSNGLTAEAILNLVPAPLVAVDRSFNVLYVNKAAADVVGMAEEDCLGKKCSELFHAQHCGTPDCCCAKAMQHKGVFTADQVASPKGNDVPIRYSAAPITDRSGSVVGAIEYVLDISEELEVTNGLVDLVNATIEGDLSSRADAGRLEGNYRAIVEGVNEAIESLAGHLDAIPTPALIVDKEFRVKFISKAGADLLGAPQAQLIGERCYDLFKAGDCKSSRCALARAMTSGQMETSETEAHPAGLDLLISYSGVPIRDRSGEIIGAMEIVSDQTQLKTAMRAADEKVDFLNKIPTPVVVVDREFTVKYMNPAGAGAVGKTPEECVGQKCFSLFRTGDCNTANCAMARAMQQDAVFTRDTVANLPSGPLPIRYTGSPLKDESGTIVGALEYVLDISKEVEITTGLGELTQAAVEGKLEVRAEADRFEGNYRTIVEGVNQTIDAILEPITESANVLEKVAGRDLTARVAGDYKGDHAAMKDNVNKAVENLSESLVQVSEAVDQLTSASSQISAGSQSLAEGANEQASSLEEVSSSLEEMASMIKQNADGANEVKSLSEAARTSAEHGNEVMDDMSGAIDKIKSSSDETAKIIKTIDEIAFQTNLLALNAAVEAARAGEAGKGFAVVAEEVRNLAQRSAEAAKNTADMIEGSVKNAEDGVRISKEVANILGEIVDRSGKVNDFIGEIAAASNEQAKGIEQINSSVAQMNKITQSNAANSEESASAAEELNAQSEELAAMIGTFTLSGNGRAHANVRTHELPAKGIKGPPLSVDGGGAGNGGNGGAGRAASKPVKAKKASKGKRSAKAARPEEVIPLEEDDLEELDLKDF